MQYMALVSFPDYVLYGLEWDWLHMQITQTPLTHLGWKSVLLWWFLLQHDAPQDLSAPRGVVPGVHQGLARRQQICCLHVPTEDKLSRSNSTVNRCPHGGVRLQE